MRMLINGIPGNQIDASDRGLQYGDGLFETIACKSGKLLLWQAHMLRLQLGCERLNIPGVAADLWLADIRKLVAAKEDSVIKLIITRGAGSRGYSPARNSMPTRIVAAYPWLTYPPDNIEKGIKVHVCKTQISLNPSLAGLKHLNRLDNVMARSEWTDEKIAEGLMLDDQGHVIEGCMSNIFAIKNGIILTPILSRCGINGVVRLAIIQLAAKNNIKLEESEIELDSLLEMDELFISNSLIGVWPITAIGKHQYPVGPVTKSIIKNLDMESDSHEL